MSEPPINMPPAMSEINLAKFKPCIIENREIGLTLYLHEDVAYVARHVGDRPGHYVDALHAMDDGRLIGVQFWWVMPDDARAEAAAGVKVVRA